MSTCVANNAVNTEFMEVYSISVFHHHVGHEAFIRLVWQRCFQKESATSPVGQNVIGTLRL